MYPDSEPGDHRPSYLERLDRLPDREKWPVVRGWLASEPRPLCEELREHRPILATPDVTLVTRRADVVEVLSLPSIFTVDLYADRMGEFMLSRDETPMNTRDKGIMQAMLSRDDLPRIRARVGELADEALDAADGRMEAVSQAARLVPLRIVQEYCGIEGPDEDLLRWSYASQLNQFNNLPFDGRRDADAVHEAALRARDEMVDHLTRVIAARGNRAGGDDVLSRLLATAFPPSIGFDMARVVINAGGLLIGTIETTAEAVIRALDVLFEEPGRLADARAAARQGPAGFDGYVWEALRFSPIIAFLFRHAAADFVLARATRRETLIPKGTVVLPVSSSAMFDRDCMDEPERFVPTRPAHSYMHFGYGHHECLGRYLGAAMVPEIVRRMLLREGIRPLGPVEDANTPFPQAYWIAYEGGRGTKAT